MAIHGRAQRKSKRPPFFDQHNSFAWPPIRRLCLTLLRWPRWLDQELRHSIIAFGGGALLAAVTLVLVPEGSRSLTPVTALLGFFGGGMIFMLIDRWR